jgi:2-polyprenyl-3-methyl-5-hydroxy-6-metoxy-1,4-benzoquinol methylase
LKSSVDERLVQLFRQLGLDRVHLAARVAADWRGLATTRPETIASLTLVCPTGLDATPLGALTSRVLVLTGDQGTPAEAISKAMVAHPEASIITLNDYYGHPRADLLTDRAEDIGAAMLAFLARMDQLHAVKPVRLPAQEGELDGISYRIQGAGAPLVLLPLGLAASQWEPLLPRLSAQYCTLTLGGAILGSVASLEARGRSTGYLGVVRNLIAEIHLHPGETILDVGCGSGVLDRWLARHTGGAHRITAVDIHRTLLREAAALATKEGLAEHIEFREGNAEVLPFGDNSFDVTMSATVMELLDAERMLREMVRVTRPGGRVGVVVRAIDMQSFVNVPVRAELKMKIAALPNGLAGARGCADGSLYQRFRNAGLQDVQMLPQLATYAGARAHAADERIEAALSPAELAEWHTAVTQAEAEGTFFIALPFHCAVGTVPLAGRP